MNLKKSISMVVMFSFLSLVTLSAYPLHAQATSPGQPESSVAKTQEKPGAVETQGAPGVQKAASFPWLIVIAGVVVAGVLLYFLVIKKSYTLTVTTATGVNGTPAAGATSYSSGTIVNYAYTPQAGYAIQVTLDGTAVASSGTVTMDKNHTLAVTAMFDITGSWNTVDKWSTYTDIYLVTCTGTASSGTFIAQGWGHGTYAVTGNTAVFTFQSSIAWVVTGTITDKNTITATYLYGTTLHGTWDMTRSPAVVSLSQDIPVKSKTIDSNN